MLSRWLRSLRRVLDRTGFAPRQGRKARTKGFSRLHLEPLEDRTVPTGTVPTLSNVSINTAVDLGSQTTLTGTINGPANQPFTLNVNWGDGSAAQTYNLAAGATTFSESYTYARPGSYPVSASIGDSDYSNDLLYASTGGTNPNPGQLAVLDLANNAVSVVGNLPGNNVTEIANNPALGQAWLQYGNNLFEGQQFDINTGAAVGSVISNATQDNFNAMTYIGGTLYATGTPATGGTSPSSLFTLNPATGQATLIGATGVNGPISGIAFDPANSTLYGIEGGTSTPLSLVSLNLTTGAATPLFNTPTGVKFGSLSFAPDGNLYAGSSTGELYSINPTTQSVTPFLATGYTGAISGLTMGDDTASVQTTVNPALTLSSTTQAVFVTSYVTNAVYEFDANTGALLATLVAPNSQSILIGPAAITVGPDGNLYITGEGFGGNATYNIVEYNFSTQTLSTFISGAQLAAANGGVPFAPGGIAFGPDGNLYTDNTIHPGVDQVLRLGITNNDGQLSYNGTNTTIAILPLTLACDIMFGANPGDEGNLYVSDDNSVVKITGATTAAPTSSYFVSPGAGGLGDACGVIWFGGNLYVTDPVGNQVLEYDANGNFLGVFTSSALQGQAPINTLFLPNGDAVVSTFGSGGTTATLNGALKEFSPSGTFVKVLSSGAFPANPTTGVTGFTGAYMVFGTAAPATESTVVLGQGTVNAPYSQGITPNGGTGAVTLAFNVTNAIAGLHITGSGTSALSITGTPTATGTETFTVTATDGVGGTTITDYTITVNPALTQSNTTQALFVTSYITNAVYEFDANTGALLATLVAPNSQSILSSPAAITVGPDGNLYITGESGEDNITEYNFSTQTLSVFISGAQLQAANGGVPFAPGGIAFGPDGNLYTDNTIHPGVDQVLRLGITNNDGQLSYNGTSTTIAILPLTLACDIMFGANPGDEGNLYVSDDNSVVKITGATTAAPTSSYFVSPGAGGLGDACGVIWFGGNLYVTDPVGNQVLEYDASGNFLGVFTSSALQGQAPINTLFLANGDAVVSTFGSGGTTATLNGALKEFSPSGTFVKVLSSGAFPANPTTGVTGFTGAYMVFGTAAPAAASTMPLAQGTVNAPYNQSITPNGGTGAVTLAVNVTNAIAGLHITGSGTSALSITGTPTATGTETFTVTATDGVGGTTTTDYTITVNPALTQSNTTQALFVTSYITNAVYEFDANTGALLATLVAPNSQSILSSPAAITVGPDGNLYITGESGEDNITEYNFSTQTLSTFISGAQLAAANGGVPFAPGGIAFGPDGNLYTDNTIHPGVDQVLRLGITDNDGQLSYNGTSTTIAILPLTLACDIMFGANPGDEGNLYVSDDNSVVKITGATTAAPTSSYFVSPGEGGLGDACGVIWQNGDLYVTDAAGNQVLEYDANGNFLGVFASLPGQTPINTLFLPDGDAVVSTFGSGRTAATLNGALKEFNSSGTFLQVLSSGAFPANPTTGVTGFTGAYMVFGTAAPATESTVVLGQGTLNAPYHQSITPNGGTGAVTLTVSNAQNAIAGLHITGSGTSSISITGTPTATGTETFTVTATDGVGGTTTTDYTITVNPALTQSNTTQALFVTSYITNAVYEFDANTGALLATLVAPNSQSILSSPAAITVGPDGNLYITGESGEDNITEYNFSTQTLSTFISGAQLAAANGGVPFAPGGIAFGPDGNLYTDNTIHPGVDQVLRLGITDNDGQLSYNGTSTTIAILPLTLACDIMFGANPGDEGNLYVSDDNSVVKITGATTAAPTSSYFVSPGEGGLGDACGVIWQNGDLYVTDAAGNQVLEYDANGNFLGVFASLPGQTPINTLFLPDGDAVVSTFGSGRTAATLNGALKEFNSSGTFLQVLSSGAFPANPTTGVTGFTGAYMVFGTAAPATESTVVLGQGTLNAPYHQSITPNGGTGAVTLTVSNAQNAIAGLHITGSGTSSISITGTPTATGTETFTVTATDGVVGTTITDYTITVNPALTQSNTTQALFVTSYVTNAVYEFDANTGALLATLVAPNSQSILSSPAAITVGPDGNLYITGESGEDNITEYNFSTQTLSVFISGAQLQAANGGVPFAPGGIAFGPDGNLYTDNTIHPGVDQVLRLGITNNDGQLSYNGTSTTIAILPLTLACDIMFGVNPGDEGNLYVSDDNSVVKITGATTAAPTSSYFVSPGAGGLGDACGVIWFGGNLYVTDPVGNQVLEYDASGNFLGVFTSSALQGQAPINTLFLPNGDAVISTFGSGGTAATLNGALKEFSPSGTFLQVLSSGAFPANPTTGVTGFTGAYMVFGTAAPAAASTMPLAQGTVNAPYNQSITPNGGTGAVTLAVNVTNAIAGLHITGNGTSALSITGTPTATGTETFTVTATDSLGVTTTTSYTITVNPAPTLSTSTLPADTIDVAYNQSISASGGTGYLALAVSNINNAIPGLNITGSGTGSLRISGTPTASGTETFTVTGTDGAGGTTGPVTYSITVPPTVSLSGAVTVDEGATYTLNLAGVDGTPNTISGWTITWGDGVVQNVTGNPPSVTHVYANGPNSYTIGATATDNVGTYTAGNTVSVTVNNGAPTLSNVSITSPVTQGNSATLTGSIFDPGTEDSFTLVVDWGDGSTPQTFTYAAGTTTFSATHTYLEEGTLPVNLTLTDSDGAQAAASTPITVNDASPTLSNVQITPSVTQGDTATLTGTLGDVDGNGFTLVVNWGDGSAPQMFTFGPSATSFSETHTYFTEGTLPVGLTLTDSDGAQVTAATQITVSNAPPTLSNVMITAAVMQGDTATLSGALRDVGGSGFTLVVDWGDGSTPQTFTYGAAATSFSETHTYLKEGTLPVGLTLTDSDGAQATAGTQITISNAPPTLSDVQITSLVRQGGTATLSGTLGDVGGNGFTLLVNWGDGLALQTFTFGADATSFTETHTYLNAGTLPIGLTLVDSDGAQATASTQITVQPPPLKGAAHLGVFDATTGTWYLKNTDAPGAPDFTPFRYGAPGWISVVGDWNGDGEDSIGVFDPTTATWYLKNTNSAGAPDIKAFQYGEPGWIPLVGDWNGDGKDSIGVFDPTTGTFYLRNETSAGAPDAGSFRYGAPGWMPVVGDWDGNGTTTVGVVDPATETWYLRNVNTPGAPDVTPFKYGAPGWQPVAGDWNGDGTTGIGVVSDDNTWYIKNDTAPGAPDLTPFKYGAPGWTALAGTWTKPVSVSNALPTLTTLEITSPVTQGAPATLTGTLADGGLSSLTLVVDWGDGSTPQTFTYPAGTTSFSEGHTYLKEGTLPVALTLSDGEGAQATAGTEVTVTNAPPTLGDVQITSPVTQGATATLTGALGDLGSNNLTLVVNWGDGSAPQTFDYAAGTTTFSEAHTYLKEGTLPISLTLTDSAGGQASATTQVTVSHAPPTLGDVQITSPIMQGGAATLSGTMSDGGNPLLLVVNWGDGSAPQTFAYAAGTTSFSETHTYLKAGTLPVGLTLTDSEGAQATAGTQITVSNAPPTLSNVMITSPITQGNTATLMGSMAGGVGAGLSLVVDWGDGSAPQTFTFGKAANSFTETHTYLVVGTLPVRLTLTDGEGSQATATTQITVSGSQTATGSVAG